MDSLIYMFLNIYSFIKYVTLTHTQGRPKDQATQVRALGLKILDKKKASKNLIWL